MKKIISLLLALLMLTAIVGCSGKKTEAPASETPKSETPTTETPTPTETPVTPTPTETPVTPTPTETPVTPTPTETPVTPTPTETPEPPQVDEFGGKTEEAMGVLPVGQYTITPVGTTAPISYPEGKFKDTVDMEPTVGGELNTFTIAFQATKPVPYYIIFPGSDSLHVLATEELNYPKDGSKVVLRGKQRLREGYWDDKSELLQWQLIKNEDGTYTVKLNYKFGDYCLCYLDGEFFIGAMDADTAAVNKFTLNMVQRGGGDAFIQYISDEGNVTIRLDTNIKKRTKLKDDQLQLWANNLDDAYNGYVELTSFVAHQNIIVKAYEPSPHIGYVWTGSEHYNVITIEDSFMRTDLTNMQVRAAQFGVVDWNFCALHEMGHMFDNGKPWNFESEMMTDFKIAYVLQKYGGCAAPSEYGAADFFYADGNPEHQQVEKCYLGLSTGKMPISESLTYNAYGAALKFVEIQRAVDDENWTAIKAVYKEMGEKGITTYNNGQRFIDFVNKISEKSGIEVRDLFTDDEWVVYTSR